MMTSHRQALRAEYRRRRRSLLPWQQRKAARQLAARLCKLAVVRRATRIAVYLPRDGEISPLRLREHPALQRKTWLLPVVRDLPAPHLRFARWHPGRHLPKNRFGIGEPPGKALFSAREIDVIVMPLVGFDRAGGRLGMGGGYYDRTLAFKKKWPRRTPTLVGVAHACQEAARLPLAAWDIPLQIIVSDQRSVVL